MTTYTITSKLRDKLMDMIDQNDVECVFEELRSLTPNSGEVVAWAIYDKRGGSKSLHWAEQHTDGNSELYSAVALSCAPSTNPAEGWQPTETAPNSGEAVIVDAILIEAIEDSVCMGHDAWDLIDPIVLVKAVLSCAHTAPQGDRK